MRNLFQKFVLGCASVLLVTAVPAIAQADDAAQPFSITLTTGYGAFTSQSQTSQTAEGKVETTNWVSKSPTGEAVIVTVSTMPGKILDPAKMISGTRDALLKSLKATLESEEKVEGTMPATSLMFNNGSAYLRARLIVSDNQLFQLLYVGRSAEQRALPNVSQLFDSFQVKATAPQTASAATPAKQ